LPLDATTRREREQCREGEMERKRKEPRVMEGRQEDAEGCARRQEGEGKGVRVGRGRQRNGDSGSGWEMAGSESERGAIVKAGIGKGRETASGARRCQPREGWSGTERAGRRGRGWQISWEECREAGDCGDDCAPHSQNEEGDQKDEDGGGD